jgi:hypothetical protein
MTETDPLEAAERLEGSMNELSTEVNALRTYGQHNRAMIWGLIASILLSIGMGVVAISASLQAKSATSQSKRNAENARITCETGNEGRRLQTQLWTYVLDLSSQNPDLTAYQKKQIAAFRGYISIVYAPRDCDNTPTVQPGTVTPTR